jgi:hypothetical protein
MAKNKNNNKQAQNDVEFAQEPAAANNQSKQAGQAAQEEKNK